MTRHRLIPFFLIAVIFLCFIGNAMAGYEMRLPVGNQFIDDIRSKDRDPNALVLTFDTSLSESGGAGISLDGLVNVSIDWGNKVANESCQRTLTAKAQIYCDAYPYKGNFEVRISGAIDILGSRYATIEAPGIDALVAVNQFGNMGYTSLAGAFRGAKNLTRVPASLPVGITNISGIFYECEGFNDPHVSLWNTTGIVAFTNAFRGASVFNQDLDKWDVSGTTSLSMVFMFAYAFNGDITTWDTSNVTNMYSLFWRAERFNQDISNWDVSKVESLSQTFRGASSFNADLSNWNVGRVTTLASTFNQSLAFSADISRWDVSNVTRMSYTFHGATSFNADISGWDVSNVSDFSYMLYGARGFNQNIGIWNTGNATNMNGFIRGSNLSSRDLSCWNVQNITEEPYGFSSDDFPESQKPAWGTRGCW